MVFREDKKDKRKIVKKCKQMKEQNADLSICVPTYNHEKYIIQALDSIFMQETIYNYEVLVGEDCSTDRTRSVLKEYEAQRDDARLKVFYRNENMYGRDVDNFVDLYRRAKGKYIITLEGDDFWIDKEKIQKQINFLENNKEYIAVAHRCQVVDENGIPNGEEYRASSSLEYSISDFKAHILPGQTASLMYRNIFKDKLIDTSILEKGLVPGDRLIAFVLICNGKVRCMKEVMSAYRHVVSGGSSFSANKNYDYSKVINWNRELLHYAHANVGIEGIKAAEFVFGLEVIHGLRLGMTNWKSVMNDLLRIKYKIIFASDYIKYCAQKGLKGKKNEIY